VSVNGSLENHDNNNSAVESLIKQSIAGLRGMVQLGVRVPK